MSRRLGIALSGLALALLACGDETPPAQPARFDRPNAVAFVCVDAGQAVELRRCENDFTRDDLALHALVTQSARGEIAAVNLETARVLDSRRDIPGFTFVPIGEMPVAVVVPPNQSRFTYVANYGSRDLRVLDTSSLVSPLSGDPTLDAVRLAVLADGEVRALDRSEAVPDGARLLAPTDVALTPDESALIVVGADEARAFFLPIQRCTESGSGCDEGLFDRAGLRSVDLTASRDRLSAPSSIEPEPGSYELLCGFERAEPTATDAPDPAELGIDVSVTAPRPISLAVDGDCQDGIECAPRVLIADQALPVIHALDLGALAGADDPADAILDPLFTGVPTRRVVVTPWVPSVPDDPEDPGTQYVYAIDETDGSVLVLEQGRLLNVNATGRTDRLRFDSNAAATALAVLTPSFDPAGGAQQWVPANACTEDRSPGRLRGVFLAVALTDQSIRIIDIHDMEVSVPDGMGEPCRTCRPGYPVLDRHQQRLDVNFAAVDNPPRLNPVAAQVLFVSGGLSLRVRSEGSTGSPLVPGLACIACSGDLVQSFPSPEDDDDEPAAQDDAGVDDDAAEGCGGAAPALVCAEQDPWATRESWIAVFEGSIPGATGQLGELVPMGSSGTLEFTVRGASDFCAAGVLGEDDIAPAYEGQQCDPTVLVEGADEALQYNDQGRLEMDIDGDQLVVTTSLLTRERIEALGLSENETAVRIEQCEALRDALAEDDARPIGFEIRRAYQDRLVLSTRLAHPIGDATHFDQIAPCLEPGTLGADVRTLNQFRVVGQTSGFLHRVRANEAGRCVVDPNADPLRQGRARLGCTYRNPSIEFRMRVPPPEQLELPPLLDFRVQTISPASKLFVTARSSLALDVISVQLRWSPTDRRLYLVDVHGRGLAPIQVDPLPLAVGQSFN